jgi:hypothetical protein
MSEEGEAWIERRQALAKKYSSRAEGHLLPFPPKEKEK